MRKTRGHVSPENDSLFFSSLFFKKFPVLFFHSTILEQAINGLILDRLQQGKGLKFQVKMQKGLKTYLRQTETDKGIIKGGDDKSKDKPRRTTIS